MRCQIDLGRDRWRCHHSKRTKEKFARVFPYAIPAGRRDSIRDNPGHSVARSAIEGCRAERFWYYTQSCLAARAWRCSCGVALQHRHEAAAAPLENGRGLGQKGLAC